MPKPELKIMKSNKAQKLFELFFVLVLLCIVSGYSSAEIIDDIRLKTDANGDVDAIIKFSVPIQYLRHFPQKKSIYLGIYFNILGRVPRDHWQDYESHISPPSDCVAGFTVTTRDLNTGPKIGIQFIRPAEFSVTPGKDGRSLLVHIKPENADQKKENKLVPGQAIAATTPNMALPGVLPAAVIALPPVTPSLPTVKPLTASELLYLSPAQPTLPTEVVPKPVVAAPPTVLNSVHIPLGGKDGLPVYPDIEQVIPEIANVPPTGKPSLAVRTNAANSQAAVLMTKAGNALLAGEMFVAIEAFNNTLNLPPNIYSQDAQIWIGIAREKAGQLSKAKLEYDTYLKLYPNGAGAPWIKQRLAKLNSIQPFSTTPQPVSAQAQSKNFQVTEYGSLSMYYYHGASHTDTLSTVVTGTGNVATPTSLSVTDQSTFISNVSVTARSYNNEFDNRLVFQDFYAANLLRGQQNKNRLNAAYFEVKNRVQDYSARIGRQSALGGGVMGRFDGVSAGYGFDSNWHGNVVAGRLSDFSFGPQPVFYGAGLDFGIRQPLGGSLYAINQTVGGVADRKAVGGNLRYFEHGKTVMAMLDYDVPFRALNMFTLQATLNTDSGTDYNFLFDRRRSPLLSIRSSVNGTTSSVDTLLQNGWTMADLILLAKQRTAISNMAQFGVSNRLKENWQIGSDIVVSDTTGMPESGTQISNGPTGVPITGLDGFVLATPSSGPAWSLSGRLIGSNVYSKNDTSMCSLSYTKSHFIKGETIILNSRANIQELWTLDSTLRLSWQTDNTGGKQSTIAPVVRVGYRVRNSLTLESELGTDWTKATPSALQSSKTKRNYFSMGFRWDF